MENHSATLPLQKVFIGPGMRVFTHLQVFPFMDSSLEDPTYIPDWQHVLRRHWPRLQWERLGSVTRLLCGYTACA
ncbi:hypothetical protein N8703_05380 [Verrucomicrobia bacterium]|nr:hypothetical protein [Verrucomicrobiota bacterium]